MSAASAPRSAAAPRRGLLDTSVVVALEVVPLAALPEEPAISALTFAELADLVAIVSL